MRMQEVTFLLCVTLNVSLIPEAAWEGWGSVSWGGHGAYFPKCPVPHA